MCQLTRWFAAVLMATSASAWAAGQGLALNAEQLTWPRWQTRLQLNSEGATASSLSDALGQSGAVRARSAALFGDYYLASPLFGDAGGLRVTSGLFVGQRGAVLGPAGAGFAMSGFSSSITRLPANVLGASESSSEATLTWPYLGVGYSGTSLRGGWGFSADVGLAAQNPGAVRLGRAWGSASFDEVVRDLRLMPMLQLGVSYKF